jgi:hypothetical protein
MTDLDKLKVCAQAVGENVTQRDGFGFSAWFKQSDAEEYDPITNSDQALELLC